MKVIREEADGRLFIKAQPHVSIDKGMLMRACKIPPHTFRKIIGLGLPALKRSDHVAKVLARKVRTFAKQCKNKSLILFRRHGPNEESVFNHIFVQNTWGSSESRSGAGSTFKQTEVIRRELPRIVQEYGIKTFLDLPCGDFNWMQHVDLGVESYIGGDIVKEIVQANTEKYSRAGRKFEHLNLLASCLPRVDLILCRDCLVHLSFEDIEKALQNLHRSGSKYLLATTFSNRDANCVIQTGQWTPYNLQVKPFFFYKPIELIDERCTEFYPDFADKTLGLWKIVDLPRNLAFVDLRRAAA